MCYFNRERHVHPFSSTPSFWVESRHSSKQSWTMWLRTSCRNVRAIGEKRPGSFLHMIIKQSHTSSRTCILQTVQCLSHTQLYYLWSLLHAAILYAFTPANSASYLSGWILYISIGKYFKQKRPTNTTCYGIMNYNQKPSEHFCDSSNSLNATLRP